MFFKNKERNMVLKSLKIKCAVPDFRLGDVSHNGKLIVDEVKKADVAGVNILVFPELCLCGYSLRDMLSSPVIVDACEKEIAKITKATSKTNVLFYVGAPVKHGDKLYNGVVCIYGGNTRSVTVKQAFDKKSPFGENRVFDTVIGDGDKKFGKVPHAAHVGMDAIGLVFYGRTLLVGCVVGNDYSRLDEMKKQGVDVIVNPTAEIALVSTEENRINRAKEISYKCGCAYVTCNAGEYESTTDTLFAPHSIVAQRGEILASTSLLDEKKGDLVCVIDAKSTKKGKKPTLKKSVENSPHPFVLDDFDEMDKRCELILKIQSHALARRLASSYSKSMVVGISGGLDSTLAVLVMVRAADILGWDRKNVVAITMPCFGTTQRTKSNAMELCHELGVTLREIDILEATKIHLRDIDHDESVRNVTYENAQARERTQILMDVANDIGGIVVGTGDLSEVALGWATYNGDHMAMYNVNSDIPKTLVRRIVDYSARNMGGRVAKILFDILDTPVSPELLPPCENGEIEQKTEDLVGPYDLHDYFIYNFVGRGYKPSKIYALAKEAFAGVFDEETIYKWLTVFVKRFVTQQFKRSASPEGIRVGSVSLSPRGDFNMPSDMSYQAFLEELEGAK